MASTDARPVVLKNTAFRFHFPIQKNDGTLISGAASITATISQDGGTFGGITGSPSVTEIATSSGVYYVDVPGGDLNYDCVVLKVTSTSTGAVTVVIPVYPQEAGDIKVDVQSISTSTTAADQQKTLLTVAAIKAAVDNTGGFTPTATEFETSAALSLQAANAYAGRSILITSGALAGEVARIVSSTYTGNSKVKLTVTSLTGAPANAVEFYVI